MQSLDFNEQDKYHDFPLLVQAIKEYLDFKKWGFKMQIFHAGALGGFSSAVIFQSDLCKIKIWTFRDRSYEAPEIYYAYGRIHAPNDKNRMTWNGKECECWHSHLTLYLILNFLDGLSPQEVAEKKSPHFPEVILNFRKDSLGMSQHERDVKYHNTIWNHYGQHLFSLFDIRSPGLWNQFVDFYQEFRSRITEHEYWYKADIC